MDPYILDKIFLVLAFAVPVALVVKFKSFGIIYGAGWHWMILIIAGEYLNMADPSRHAAMLDHIWIMFGWIWAILYCAGIYMITYLFRKRKN